MDDERTGDMLAVMGMEMTESAFFKLIVDNVRRVPIHTCNVKRQNKPKLGVATIINIVLFQVGLKNETGTDWYIVDSSG